MNTLRWANLGLLFFGLTMFVTLGVVCLIYAIYLPVTPRLQEEWPTLMWSTLLFGGLAAIAAVAFHGLRTQARWRWAGQGALVFALFTIGAALWRLLIAA